mmetsp:Transcript_53238/g.148756  ORF Transcript_53238/g.148756 Transcript_53238/m.148756 type:complete len:242 (-) Transcript_53238:268-993(-)
MLLSSRLGTPNCQPGLSLHCLQPYPLVLQMPLLSAQSRIMRSLSSVYSGCFSRKRSSHSNVPSSGKPTGSSTSYAPPFGLGSVTTSQSTAAASWTARHLKGSSARVSGPKFTCTVTFRNVTAGKSGLPFNLSGIGCGWQMRVPSLKRLTVSAFGLAASRFSSTATTLSRPNPSATLLVVLLWVKDPATSKKKLSSEDPRTRPELDVEKPMRSTFVGCGGRPPFCPLVSAGCSSSTIFTSNM